MSRCSSCRKRHVWDAVSNSSKYNIFVGTQLIQLYKFVCIITKQNINTNVMMCFINIKIINKTYDIYIYIVCAFKESSQ